MTDAGRDRWSEYLRTLADRMGLKDWRVQLADVSCDPEHDAMVHCVRGRRIANFRLPEGFDAFTPERQRHVLVHELAHCFFAAMDELVMGRWDGHEYDAFLIPFEYGVDAVADALAPHLPLPLRSSMLKKGYSKKSVSANIKAEKAAGKPQKQSVAIALETARDAAKKAGKSGKGPKAPAAKKSRKLRKV